MILELVRGALEYAEGWCQGLKILFTDSEERNLDGIRCALERDNALFDNVGLVVRGPLCCLRHRPAMPP